MGIFKGNINALLGTVLFHLIAIAAALMFSISTSTVYKEAYTYVELDFIEEILKESHEEEKNSTNVDMENFDIENYITGIRNIGSNYSSSDNRTNNVDAMSQEELRKKYESELLREKYGDDYEKITNRTYEDYLSESNSNNTKQSYDNKNNSQSSAYSGPALVFVELENPNRGNSYIHVPVFTCRDGGTVIINITINTDGRVRSANVLSANSKGDASCISNAAKDAALKSRFTTVAGSGTENGKITYQFIEQ
ncbi:MAG: energy transducer TonB [Bacteroidales bacterium]|nr:energy transducer TonB [Bacteroidales bacterium]